MADEERDAAAELAASAAPAAPRGDLDEAARGAAAAKSAVKAAQLDATASSKERASARNPSPKPSERASARDPSPVPSAAAAAGRGRGSDNAVRGTHLGKGAWFKYFWGPAGPSKAGHIGMELQCVAWNAGACGASYNILQNVKYEGASLSLHKQTHASIQTCNVMIASPGCRAGG